ncbi:MAG: Non-ribosomal peptide synthetase module [Benniella sp.]|nr:MAG: Non-ribosomal peptide synthetase module [Benniella sp.]
MSKHDNKFADIIPDVAQRAMDEHARVKSENPLGDSAKSLVVTHALGANDAMELSLSGGQVIDGQLVGHENNPSLSLSASSTMEQMGQPLPQAQHDFWRKAIAGAPAKLDLPTDGPRASYRSADRSKVPILLDVPLTQLLKNLAAEHNMDLSMVIMTGWGAVLARLSGQDGIIIGFHDTGPGRLGSNQQTDNSILPLRLDLSGELNTFQLLERVRKMALSSMDHRGFPLGSFAEFPGSPLFQVAFRWNSLHSANSVHVDLELQLQEQDNKVVGDILFPSDLFHPDTIKRHAGYLSSILQTMVVGADQPAMSIDLLSKDELDIVLGKWNDTQQDYPDHLCIHHLFEEQAESAPEATAVVFNSESLTYAELNERANRLAHHLIGLGVQPESLVAICVERSFAMVIAVLAILKAGGAYIPLDPSYAGERLRDILMDASPHILIADQQGQQALGEGIPSSVKVVDPNGMDVDSGSNSVEPGNTLSNPQVSQLTSSSLAYIIYTSGSTGKPKGVMVEHQGLTNLVMTRHDVYGINASSRVLQFFSFAFDGCAMDIFSSLCSGASLHILPDAIRYSQRQLWDYLEQNSITQALLPPAIFQGAKDLPQLSTSLTLILGGESLPAALIQALQPLIPNGRIVNDYGPTEATVSSIAWKCPQGFSGDTVPIGRPVANKRIYILDAHRKPVPLGAIGELYIGGVGVARGYLNRPELTSSVFLSDPFSGDKDARMYKTGDQARYLPDGNIIFLGRNDHQIKLRGFRIELGEIEARLCDYPPVQSAVVIATGEGSDKRLVAYVVAEHDDQLAHTLRSHLTSRLPEYMVPGAIVRLDSLPLNSNGKLDRKALPVPDNDAYARQIYEEPQGEDEIAVAQIWNELLHLDRVSRNDNFFALGGHSLLAVRLMNRIASLGVQMPLSALFASPTLMSFAESVSRYMDKESITYKTIDLVLRDGHLPLSFSQQRMWFIAQMEGTSETYHLPTAVRIRGALDRDALQRALDTLFARHESLRSVFVAVDGQPQVRLLPAHSGMPIRWEDIRGTPDVESQLERMCADEAMNPFDLAKGPLIRVLMVQLDTNEHVFMVTQHHIVSDGWSSAIFNRELSTLYSAYRNGDPDPLVPLSIQYPDYAAWQKQQLSGDRLESHIAYWKTAMTDAPVLLNLPTDRPRPPQQSFVGDNIPISLDPHLSRALKHLCQEHGVTLYMAILTAWSCVLSQMSGQDDIVIGSPSANRNHHQIESLIGFFVNTLALRIDLSGSPTMRQLLERVRKTSLDAQNHQDLPFEQVVDIVQPPRSLSHSPLFQVMFVLQNNETSELQLPGLEVTDAGTSYDIAKFDLTLGLFESDDEITGSMSYSTVLFDRATMERHVGYLFMVLQAMTADVDRPVMSVNLVSQAERDIVLGEWNDTERDYPSELCIHQLFEQQVEHNRQATALVFNGESLTYAELNERANRLAHHLIGLGVQPESLVAICVERSFAMVIAVLAILKAGGAYIPLDPSYAGERLRDILMDASPHILIADQQGQQALGEGIPSSVKVIDPNGMDVDSGSNSVEPGNTLSNPQVSQLTSSSLAYIIYTSGSTGIPKGVMVEHQGLTNLVMTRHDVYGISASSRVLQFFSFAFDGCAMDIFSSLCSGASLHILPDAIRYSQRQLWEYLEQNSITQALLPPAIFQGAKDLPQLSTSLTLILGGESLPAALIQALQPLIPNGRIVNDYGPTEATVSSIAWKCPQGFSGDTVPIGRPVANKRIYILDAHRQPVPLGAIGELYIGGVGVARGYLNRPELTSSVFLSDPFSGDKDARMYKTGDQARYLPDGNIIFLGRNDHQVKIRGFRIELGEIEARLCDHPLVDKAVVITIGDESNKRLVGYIVAKPHDDLLSTLRSHLTSCLPEYMIPAAIVRLDSLPLNSNGKLDRKALPVPDSDAYSRLDYEAPQGENEIAVARIWADLLKLDRVSRNDNFFALGGHSLLAVRMIEHLRRIGLTLTIRALFKTPTLSALVQSLDVHISCDAPANLIIPDATTITPEMLPLISLSQTDIDHIVQRVPGGVSNIQDIYALSPLQEGILFHHLLANEGDPYLLISLLAFETRQLLDKYIEAVQMVVDRHDILRTAIFHENLSTPAQVVWRQASLSVTELQLDLSDGLIVDQLKQRLDPRQHRIDLTQAPLLRFTIAQDTDGRWILVELLHHLIGDHSTLEAISIETKAFMDGLGHSLTTPQPFRNLIAQAQLNDTQVDHETFFKEMLMDIDTPSLPFGLKDVHGQGDNVTTSYQSLPQELNNRLRRQAKQLGVSVASLCHLAWAQVVSRTSGEDRVVFGTVLFGRMNSGQGSDNAMGLFINTLPIRIDLTGTVHKSVLQTHERLASLLEHEHASLVLAQRCSSVPQGTPLFSAMLNYRHNTPSSNAILVDTGIEYLEGHERTNYPFTLSVEDCSESLGLTAEVVQPFSSVRVCGYMLRSLESLVSALELAPDMMTHELNILPETEQELMLQTWNKTQKDYPADLCIHHLFEQQAKQTPEAKALVFNDQSLTYAELNERANRLAHHLISLGVHPDSRVAICVNRSLAVIVGLLAILKAGGAYVPIDPTNPKDRLESILEDSLPTIMLIDTTGRSMLQEIGVLCPSQKEMACPLMVDPNDILSTRNTNPEVPGLTSRHLAYIIYTSGSTGKPKGVMIEHQGVVSRVQEHNLKESSRFLQFTSLSFDVSVLDIFTTLCAGAILHLLQDDVRRDLSRLWDYLQENSITHTSLTPTVLQDIKCLSPLTTPLNLRFVGEILPSELPHALRQLLPEGSAIINEYGPTEATIAAVRWNCDPWFNGDLLPIGHPMNNVRIYILDSHRFPVPLGTMGEIYIGGVGVARGYLNRPELTSSVFLPDPFTGDKDARMYKTGDLARYLPDGNIIILGRNDHQVKIRGFRIELGEIEARLVDHPLVDKSVVITIGEGSDKRLVGYVVAKPDDNLLDTLRSHLKSCVPEYMIPAAIVRLDSLPLNPNGKLDRKALPAPDSDAFARQMYEEPQGDVEIAIAQIWAEVLNPDHVSRHDNFFALGGHSLLAVRLMNRVASLGVQLPLSSIFTSPTLSSFAESVSRCMERNTTTYSIIHPVSRDGDLPISFSQQRMWFLAQMEGTGEAYHIPMAVRLRGDLNRGAWERALNTLFARHESLRSAFVAIDGRPQVRLLPAQSGMPIRWEDLQGTLSTGSRLEQLISNEATKPFDLERGPLVRAVMVQLDSNEHVFMVTHHHIISDGWSSAIFDRELSILYSAYCDGESNPLPPLSIQYSDYAAWQKQWLSGVRLETLTTYWKTVLTDAPVILDLPTDRPRPLQQSYAGDNVPISLDAHVTRVLKQLCQKRGVTLYTAILAAWSCVLSRMSGQDDIVIGSPSANRNHHQIESLIGLFVNTLALRIDLSGNPTVLQLLERVGKASLDAQNHQDLPFEQVVDIVQPPRSLSHSPLFQVMFVLQNDEASELQLPGLAVADANPSYDITKFDLTLRLYESDNELMGSMSYSTALFDRATVERHIGYLSSMLHSMAVAVDVPVMSVNLLSQAERDLVLGKWNETQQDYPTEFCIHHLFEQRVEMTPQATALVSNGESLTYVELNERANRLAVHLNGLGVQPESLVAICVERSIAMIVGVLAILKAGGAYVPLDPSYASNRLKDILTDASPSIVVADSTGRSALGEVISSMTVVDPNETQDADQEQERNHAKSVKSKQLVCNPHVPGLTSSNLAYIIYTSGSTGKPKGVMIEHRGVVNLIHGRPESFGISTSSRALLFTSLSFDHSVSEIFSALTGGACLHLVQDEIRLDRPKLWEYFEQHSITHTSITPTLLQDSKDSPSLKTPLTFIIMGETLPATLIPQVQKAIPNGNIINEYGPTETTVATTIWKCPNNFQSDIVPIGRPIPNKTMYLLDEHQQPVPMGATGELYIGGVGVARGYLNRAELTAKTFLPDPFSEDRDARMYKTGDLARYLPDGNIMFLGRNDHQVKIRGFRIELGEIEARLVDHPLVDKAVVITVGEGSDKKLVSYVVAKPDDNLLNTLRSHLTSCLPEYMVPAAIVQLDSLPLNSNGKLDRKALPAPDSNAFARQIYEEPQGEDEIAVAQIWNELLHLDRVSRNDNFFALGGHSLLAVRLMNRIASLGVQMPLSALFASPTLMSFAESVSRYMDKESITYKTIDLVPREAELPLSFSQQRMWFIAQIEGTSETYHMPTAVRIRGVLNRDALQRALDTLFARHESLRSVFVAIDGQPQVRLLPAHSGMPIRWEDIRGTSDVDSQLERMCADEAMSPFDLAKGPLIRVLMVQLDTNEHVFMVTQHHIVSDGWSSAIFNRELSTLYSAYRNGDPDPLAPLSIQYPDYAAWQKQQLSGDRLEGHIAYWKTAMTDAPVLLNLPTDRPRPPQQSFVGDNIPISLDPHLSHALKHLCQEHGVTLYMAILTAWSCVLSQMSGQDDIVIGSPSANRNHHQIESLIGFFVNTLALRIDLSGSPTMRQLLERVRKTSLDAQNHQDLPFEQVVDIVQPPRSLSHSPLFQVVFVLQNNETSELQLPGLEVTDAGTSYDIAKFDLTLGLFESDDEITGSMSYSTALFDRATMERHVGYLFMVLQAMTADVDRPVMSVNLVSQAERDIVLGEWNDTERDYPSELCIHQLFEQQVEHNRQATALVFNGASLTYAELNERANRLAHHLIGLGVQPESLVAICVERSFAMVIAVLAILKAGGAYIPLDPSYAGERLRDILVDASPHILIADQQGQQALGEGIPSSVKVVDPNGMDVDSGSNSVEPGNTLSNPQVSQLTSSSLAYIIYTSGSTGKPKGVMVEHQGLTNLVMTRHDVYGISASSRVLQFFSFAFDGCAMDIFSSLCSGASLHILPDAIRYSQRQLWEYLEQNSITQALLPPAIFQGAKDLPQLSTSLTLILGGESLPAALIQALQPLIPNGRIVNDYGPTEATVSSIAWKCPPGFSGDTVPIGRPVANKRIYILDAHRQPVPLGAIGELYIGGVGVARGYLNRPELTSSVFLSDPFSGDKDARMYKTGDQARYLPDGNIIFLGRNDHQVKIRGFRIELGEIEARLCDHPLVDKAVVITIGDESNKRLVGYTVAKPHDDLLSTLRSHLTSCLPEYMIPAAIVRLDSLPLNSNGKLDRKALPIPDSDAYSRLDYEAPQGENEIAVARIWADLLKLDRVSRNDNFFALGGHSLLAVRMIEHLRRIGLTLTIRALFKTPTLSALVQSLDVHISCDAPANLIIPDATAITPEMLPLISLSQTDIDHIVQRVPGGVSNIQDIYALSPLQEGILFHHLLANEGDPYLLISLLAFETRQLLDKYIEAVQMVVDRHDILRTAIFHENLSTPAQVVWRQASLSVTELQLDLSDGLIVDQLKQRLDPRQHRIDLTQAPLLRFTIAQDTDGRWILVELLHHLIGDHSTLEAISIETKAFMDGLGHSLTTPQPFRNLIAQAQLNDTQVDHETFFKEMLMDIDTPSLPFGLKDVHGQGDNVTTSYQSLPQELNNRLRRQAKQLGVSVASLCHLAWAQVVSRTSGEDRVVFGTVLFGRMNSGQGSDSAMGLFINSLPLRVDLTGAVRETVLQTHERLASLLEHEHASLVLAQRCSSVPQGTPLFSAMLNYRHTSTSSNAILVDTGIQYLESQERTNYPFTLSVEDYGGSLGLTAKVVQPLTPTRVCGFMHQALESLVSALELAPDMMTHELKILPDDERELLIQEWNTTQQDHPADLCIHHLFEQQVDHSPYATALVFNGESLTYAELNERANRLAHHLIGMGVKSESPVAICVGRSFAMIIGVLAILKTGGAYVPLDPSYASERLRDILMDASPHILIADHQGQQALGGSVLSSVTVVDPNEKEADSGLNSPAPSTALDNPHVHGLTSSNLAYIIYTSGSTGKPKGVMVEHQGLPNLVMTRHDVYGISASSRVLQFFSFAFDGCAMDTFSSLCSGATLHILPDSVRYNQDQLWDYLEQNSITQALLPPAIFQGAKNLPQLSTSLTLILGGESLPAALIQALQPLIPNGRIVNDYGPTEATVSSIAWKCPQGFSGDTVPIGRPVANKRIYILDEHRKPVPLGAIGELYIGGVGVARGYLNRPELTSSVFLSDPFSGDRGARMYKTGDQARYLPDGNIIFLGRNDHQVKIRGFRIELGEIEARLRDHPLVQSVVVVASREGGEKRLVAYVVAKPDGQLVHTLRTHLKSCLPDYMIPAAFVRLDDLPMTANGKLDRIRLPQPDAMALQQYEPPRGTIETALMTIWMELLNIDRIGRHDNFFMLGGHSLLAMRMISQIQSLMGFKLALGTLFMAPTIAELVPYLLTAGKTQEEAFNVLLPIRPRGTRLPVFCVHPGWGISWCFIGLTKHLHPDQPIYGLQARGYADREWSADTFDDVALDYIDQIRKIQPQGPYCLLGYSFGGKAVHTMAAHLERQGERVVLLGVMDTLIKASVTNLHGLVEDPDSDAQKDAAAIKLFTNRVGDAIPDSARPYVDRFYHVTSQLTRLSWSHTLPTCKSDMILFRAMVGKEPICPSDWKPYVMGKIDVFDVDCKHPEMDQPAAMAEVGRVLAQRLDEIHTREAKEQ